MQLHYLDFDFSDEDSGRGSFDAMATVAPSRVAAALDEIAVVLAWAQRSFGPAAALGDDGEWDCELQALTDSCALDITHDERSGKLALSPEPGGDTLTTITFTLSGSSAFCDALRQAFEIGH